MKFFLDTEFSFLDELFLDEYHPQEKMTQKNHNYIIYKTPIVLLLKIITLILFSDIFLFIIDLFFNFMEGAGRVFAFFTATEEIFLGVAIFHLVLLIYLFLEWMFDYYWIESGILHHRKGIIFRKNRRFVISEIAATTFFQRPFGRIFNYGSVVITLANKEFILQRISTPGVFIDMLSAQKNIAPQTPDVRK